MLKYMMSQAVNEGFKVLIFDSKITGPEFEGVGTDIPFYLQESTDPDVFRSLLEGMRTRGKGNMERYRGGFIEVCDGAKDFMELGERLQAKLSDKRIRGGTRMMYYEINHDYKRLMKLLEAKKFSKKLVIPGPIARMPTWELPNLALQGLIVASTVEETMRTEEKMIYLIDEAPNFVSQKQFNPAKHTIQIMDAQGRSKQLFGWYSGQTLTGFDKANMKNLWYWVIGREMEQNEAKDAYGVQTTKILTLDQVRTLKVREFLVATPDFTKLVTVPYVDEEMLFPQREFWEVTPETVGVPEDWSDIHEEIKAVEAMLN